MQGPPRDLGPGSTVATTPMNLAVSGRQGTAANMDVDLGHVRHGSAKLVPLSSAKQTSGLIDATRLLGKEP